MMLGSMARNPRGPGARKGPSGPNAASTAAGLRVYGLSIDRYMDSYRYTYNDIQLGAQIGGPIER